jgi:hypothetical protein
MTPLPDAHHLDELTARARRAATAAGELSLGTGAWESPLHPDLRQALRQILDDGTYARAAAAVATDDVVT